MFRLPLVFFRAPACFASLTFSILCSLSCDSNPRPPEERASGTPSQRAPVAIKRPEKEAVAHVPVGKFLAGSLPGQPGRDPSLEPLEVETELGPFRIDVYPYPGNPDAPARKGLSKDEAAALCAQKSGRLCTELEWERACRGPSSSIYATGAEPCPKGDDVCLSGFDIAEMGSLLEWTSSSFGKASDHAGASVARGAPRSAGASERRCARRAAPGKEELAEVGFRCCYGAPNAASLTEPKLGEPYREVEISKADLTRLLASDDRTKELAKDVSLFKPETAQTVLARGPGDTMGFTLTTSGVEWQPTRGSKFLVVTGRSGERTSFVLAYFLGGTEKTLAGSFIMQNEPGPIALAYAKSIRPRMHFSGCWGCPGETGKLLFRPPEELVMLQP